MQERNDIMNSNFEFFLSHFEVDIKETDTKPKKSETNYKDRILNENNYEIGDFNFSIVSFKLLYPKPLEKLITKDGIMSKDPMEEKYDTMLIVDYYNEEKHESISIGNLFYTSHYNLEDANKDFQKLNELFINETDSEKVFEKLNKLLEN